MSAEGGLCTVFSASTCLHRSSQPHEHDLIRHQMSVSPLQGPHSSPSPPV